jgi:peptidoglycan/xylan/chitin deacetylase (PgdA/CDA1 family)
MQQTQSVRAPAAGDKFSGFHLEKTNGDSYDWKPGRVTLITFCAFWCDTWKTHLARVAKTDEELNGLPIDYVAVSVDGRWTELGNRTPYMNRLEALKDPGGAWSTSLGIDKVPYTFILDADGVVRWAGHGVQRSEEMAGRLREALGPRLAGGEVYLTFDDFPKAGSDSLLDTLRALNVKATFFCVCDRAISEKDLLQRAVREGHVLEIHAWNHDDRNVDVNRCVQALVATTGQAPTLIRRAGKEEIDRLDGGKVQAYAVDPYDFLRPGVKEMLRRILSNLRSGCEIQLHAGVSDTLTALPEIVAGIRRQGYTIGQLGAVGLQGR